MNVTNLDLANLDAKPYFKRQVRNLLKLMISSTAAVAASFYNRQSPFTAKLIQAHPARHPLFPDEISVEDSLMKTAETIAGEELRLITGEDLEPLFAVSGKAGSLLILPVSDGKQLAGFVMVITDKGKVLTEEEIVTCTGISNNIKDAAFSANLLEKYKERNDHLSIMLEVNTHLNVAATKTDFLSEISRFGRYFINFDRAVLTLRPEDTPEYFVIDSIEGGEADLKQELPYPIYRSLVSQVITTGRHQVYKQTDSEVPDGIYRDGDLEDYPYVQTIAFPLAKIENGPGALVLEAERALKIKDVDMNIFEMISLSLGAALNRFSLYERLNNYASIDTLTRLYNLRALKQRFEEELSRAQRYQTNLAILFLDLDKFKRVNDTHGHLMGDYVLRETARLIKESVRTADIVGRYGGEEFVVIMINTDAESCRPSADRIASAIREFNFEMNDVQLNSKISIGVSEFPSDGTEMEDLIQAADAAMYTAKRNGGDQVIRYEDGMVPKSKP